MVDYVYFRIKKAFYTLSIIRVPPSAPFKKMQKAHEIKVSGLFYIYTFYFDPLIDPLEN